MSLPLTVENREIGKYVFNLYVKPNSIVQLPYRQHTAKNPLAIIRANEARKIQRELKKNQTPEQLEDIPVLSVKAKRRLITAINWLVASAKDKTVYNASTKSTHNFKISFITLTLPTVGHGISDSRFKNKLLHNFLSVCNSRFGMVNYVWKVETQENGNIHAHITTDVFIHHKDLRQIWNRILEKEGVLKLYTEKHQNMSFEDYVEKYSCGGKIAVEKLRKRFDAGELEGWKNPNSTDIHAVNKVRDLGAYLSKYFSKEDKERRRIIGRVWACSYSLSVKNKLVLEVSTDGKAEELNELATSGLEVVELTTTNKTTGEIFSFGLCYFVRHGDWGKVIKGKLLEMYREHLMRIRNGFKIDMLNENVLMS